VAARERNSPHRPAGSRWWKSSIHLKARKIVTTRSPISSSTDKPSAHGTTTGGGPRTTPTTRQPSSQLMEWAIGKGYTSSRRHRQAHRTGRRFRGISTSRSRRRRHRRSEIALWFYPKGQSPERSYLIASPVSILEGSTSHRLDLAHGRAHRAERTPSSRLPAALPPPRKQCRSRRFSAGNRQIVSYVGNFNFTDDELHLR